MNITNLYYDIGNHLASYLTLKDLLALCRVSKGFNQFVRSLRIFTILQEYHKKYAKLDIDFVCKEKSIELLQYLLSSNLHYTFNAIDYAAMVGNLDIIKYFDQSKYEFKYSNMAFIFALKNGHKDVCNWFIKSKYHFSYICIIGPIIELGDIETILWLLKVNPYLKHSTWIIDHAARFNRLDLLEYFYNTDVFKYSHMAVDQAIKNGHFNIVKWFHDSKYELKYSYRAIDNAAYSGRLDIIKWFVDNNYIFIYDGAIYNAVKNGHLDILEWFDNRYSIRYYRTIINFATIHGHLHIIQWILNTKYRYDFCSVPFYSDCIDHAASNGHLHIIEWFDKSKYQFIYRNALFDAYRYNNQPVINWFENSRHYHQSIKTRIFYKIYYWFLSKLDPQD